MKKLPPDEIETGELRAIQRAFGSAVMRSLDENQQMQRTWTNGQPTLDVASSIIKPNDRMDSFERLEIYNRQYWFRLIDCFYDDFPALHAVLGDDRFYQLTIEYLEKNPSRSFTLRDLGEQLESFLEREPAWIDPHPELARDVVRLEWAHIVAFDGPELPLIEMDALLGADPSSLRLGFQPYLTFLACEYEVDDFVLAIRKKARVHSEASNAVSEPARTSSTGESPLPRQEKIWLAVHRLKNAVYYKRIEREAYLMLSALRQGLTLESACESALCGTTIDEAFAARLQSWFAQWASFGWLCQDKPRSD